MTVIMDPWSLTWESPILSELEAESYVERLTELFELSKSLPVPMVISDEAAELLVNDGSFPLVTSIPPLLWPNRCDVFRLVTSLLDKLPKLNSIGVATVLIDNMECAPPYRWVASQSHKSHLDELLSIALLIADPGRSAPPVLSSRMPDDCSHEISVVIVDAECSDGKVLKTGIQEGAVDVKNSITSCFGAMSPVPLATGGRVHEAIALSLWQYDGACTTDPFRVEDWSLGDAFLPSAKSCGFFSNAGRMAALLLTCTRVIRRVNERATHELRRGGAGGAPQMVRACDQAGAWRVDLGDEYHLHYWSIGGKFEFANVVVHNDFGIDA